MNTLGWHQEFALCMMDSNNALGIGYKPGTGKTICALSWVYYALQDGRIEDALIICPASLVSTWKIEMDNMINYEGFTAEGIEVMKNAVFVTSYQKLSKIVTTNHVRRKTKEVYQTKSRILRPEVDKHWGAIILDESHSIGAHDSVQTQACISLSTHTENRFALTGTPCSGGGGGADYKKLYGQIKFLEPSKWRNWTEWTGKYVLSYDQYGAIEKYREEECKQLLEDYFIFCTLEGIRDIPGMEDTTIPCELEEKKMYKDIDDGNFLDYGIDIESSGSQFLKLLQICSGSMKRETDTMVVKTNKDAALKTILDGTDDKVVVFCNFSASIDRVAEICKGYGKTVVYDGRSKKDTWEEFQYGDAKYLVAQYQCGGTGLNLYSSATMVFWEPTMSSLILEQTKARIHRTGQTRLCRYVYLTTPKTVENEIWKGVRKGMEITVEMMKNWSITRAKYHLED